MALRVLTYGEINREEWETLIKESKTGTWFQTPEAYDFFASQREIMRPFVLAVRWHQPDGSKQSSDGSSQQTLRGVCCGYVTIEKNPLKQYFTRRAIIIGGPVLADDCSTEEAYVLMQAVRRHLMTDTSSAQSPIYIETRNFNDYTKWSAVFGQAGFIYQPHLNFHFDCRDKDLMWAVLSETRRRQIRKTLKNGAAIEEAQTEQELTDWYRILADLYHRKVKTPLFPLSFFLAFYRQRRGVYLLVKYAGKVIGGIMCPVWEGRCIYEWFICGLDGEYHDLYPSVLATWAAMEYAHTHGIPKYDMMGAGVPGVPYGVRNFKAEFGGELVEHGRFLYIAKPILYRIGVLGVRMMKNQ